MAKRLTIPPTDKAMADLTADQLHALASAVVAEQHRRVGEDGRRKRTERARRALKKLTPAQRKAQTAAATAARLRKRLESSGG